MASFWIVDWGFGSSKFGALALSLSLKMAVEHIRRLAANAMRVLSDDASEEDFQPAADDLATFTNNQFSSADNLVVNFMQIWWLT